MASSHEIPREWKDDLPNLWRCLQCVRNNQPSLASLVPLISGISGVVYTLAFEDEIGSAKEAWEQRVMPILHRASADCPEFDTSWEFGFCSTIPSFQVILDEMRVAIPELVAAGLPGSDFHPTDILFYESGQPIHRYKYSALAIARSVDPTISDPVSTWISSQPVYVPWPSNAEEQIMAYKYSLTDKIPAMTNILRQYFGNASASCYILYTFVKIVDTVVEVLRNTHFSPTLLQIALVADYFHELEEHSISIACPLTHTESSLSVRRDCANINIEGFVELAFYIARENVHQKPQQTHLLGYHMHWLLVQSALAADPDGRHRLGHMISQWLGWDALVEDEDCSHALTNYTPPTLQRPVSISYLEEYYIGPEHVQGQQDIVLVPTGQELNALDYAAPVQSWPLDGICTIC